MSTEAASYAKYDTTLESAEDVFEAETDRNTRDYARLLKLSVDDIQKITADQDVLDMGSGLGYYAAEAYYWKSLGLASPNQVDSLNIRYAAPDYLEFITKYIYKDGPKKLELPPNVDASLHDEAKQEAARLEAYQHFLGLDWNNLSSIPDAKYGVIMSVFAFPYYSDLVYLKPESRKEFNAAKKSGNNFNFGPQSKHVFRELVRILKPGGVMLFATDLPMGAWQRSTGFQKEFSAFFAELGCKLEVPLTNEKSDSNDKITIRISKLKDTDQTQKEKNITPVWRKILTRISAGFTSNSAN